jgi:hypothetical protein
VLYLGLEDLLDNAFGAETVRSVRVGLSLLATVTGVSWYHLRVFRADQNFLTATGPTPPPSPRKHLILVSPRGSGGLAGDLARATDADLDHWYLTAGITMPDTDIEELAARIEATDATDILVLLGPGGATLVPFETDLPTLS